jgi:uncharacterized glyoxalase superfamily protein PhnB
MPDLRAPIEEPMRRAQDAGAEIVIEAGNQEWGYAGAFADPDGHMWQVGRADGFLTR